MKRRAMAAAFAAGLLGGAAVTILVFRDRGARYQSVKPAIVAPTSSATASEREVRVSPGMLQNLGVRTARVEQRVITEPIHTTGYVDYDQRRVSQVNGRVSGWVEKLNVSYVGEEVKKGQPLLEIYSPELVLTQEDYLRARKLATGKAGGQGSTRRDGEQLMAAAEERLELFGVQPSELKRLATSERVSMTVPIAAEAGGVVIAIKVVEGSHVKAGDELYTIADLSRVWVYADIYERELPHAHLAQRAQVTSDALPATTFPGTVSYIYPGVNEQTRTVRVRLEFVNPKLELRPGMYVKVTLLDESPKRTLAVPTEAVLSSGVRRIVIVALGEGRFEPREVEVGSESGGYYPVLGGLAEGERLVTSAQFLIDSESNLREALNAMTLGGAESGVPQGSPSR